MMAALHDLIVVKYADKNARVVFFATKEAALEIGDAIPSRRLIYVYDAICEAHELCVKNANTQNILVNLSSKIRLAANH